jgi:prephenate dehydratase
MLLQGTSQPLAPNERQPNQEEDHVRRAAVNDHPSHGRRAMVGSRKAAQVSAKVIPVDSAPRAMQVVGLRAAVAVVGLRAAAAVGLRAAATAIKAADASATRTVVAARRKAATRRQQRRFPVARFVHAARSSCRPQ